MGAARECVLRTRRLGTGSLRAARWGIATRTQHLPALRLELSLRLPSSIEFEADICFLLESSQQPCEISLTVVLLWGLGEEVEGDARLALSHELGNPDPEGRPGPQTLRPPVTALPPSGSLPRSAAQEGTRQILVGRIPGPCGCCVFYRRVCLRRIYALMSSFAYLAVPACLLCACAEVKSQGNRPITCHPRAKWSPHGSECQDEGTSEDSRAGGRRDEKMPEGGSLRAELETAELEPPHRRLQWGGDWGVRRERAGGRQSEKR